MRMLAARAVRTQIGLWLIGLVVVAAAFGGGYWYSLDSVAARYDTVLAENRDIVRVVTRPGRTAAAREETLRFGVSGIVGAVLAKPGQPVVAGDPLVRLDSPAAKLAAEQAYTSLELARLRLEDMVRQANDLVVTAPFSGRVASVPAISGETVARGAVAAVIEDPDRMVVEVRVPEHLVAAMKPGQQVRLAFPTLAGRIAPGWVAEVGGSLQGQAGSAYGTAQVAFRNPGGVVAGTTVVVSATVEGSALPALGRVVPAEGQVLAAQDAATVLSVPAVPGQAVQAGDLLVEMENEQLSIQCEQALLTYNSARQRYESVSIYYTNPDDPMLVNSRLQYQQAKLNYDQLAARVAALRVTASWPGTVAAVNVKAGDVIPAGTVVAQLVRKGSFMVTAMVPTARFAGLGTGQGVLVDLPELGVSGVAGTVVRKSGQAAGSGASSSFEITVEARYPALQIPWPGTVARVNLPAGQETFEASGSARAEQRETVRFGASGTVAAVAVTEGSMVTEGSTLMTLANESLIAPAAVVSPDEPLTADSALLESIAGPSLREEMLRTRSAELAYRQKLTELAALTLRASYSGTLADVKVKAGDAVAAGTAGATIVDNSTLDVVTDISELDIASIAVGQEMEVYFAAVPDSGLGARVTEIGLEPRQASEGALYPLRLRLSGAAGIRGGMNCVVAIVTDIRRNVLAVPVECVQSRFGAKAVRVVLDRKQETSGTTSIQRARVWKGDVEWAYVVTGVSDGAYVEILKGLSMWSEVVVRERGGAERATTPAGGL
ncbi:MAG: HlyD family efflux transporter periplasmic adaptor subunit [Bacillota bacterium]|nr:HlyD family efflux transporter periplasmic adaptor subunit [Bacillota bacterium]